MDNPYDYLQPLLLLVLFLPLVWAGVVAVAGRAGTGAARRTAAYLAAGHLLLTIAVVAVAGAALGDRVRWGYVGSNGRSEPLGVSGSLTNEAAGVSGTVTSGWSLLSLAPTPTGKGRQNVPASEVQFFVGLDGLNLPLVFLASLMTFLAVLVSWENVTEKAGGFYAWVFALQTAATGAFVAFDIILFYVFFELTLVPAFFLIGRWGVGGGRRDAARKFVLYTLAGGLLTLTGIVGVVLANPTPLNPFVPDPEQAAPVYAGLVEDRSAPGDVRRPVAGPVTFSIPKLVTNHITWSVVTAAWIEHQTRRANRPDLSPAQKEAAMKEVADARAEQGRYRNTQFWIFVALMAGFVVKIPLVPFHTWLPSAYGEAPLGVTMLFSAVLAKLGTFGIIRLVLPLTPEMSIQYGLPGVGVLAAAGIVYAAFCAYGQRDLKQLAAYSSVSHLGFLVLGLFAFTPESLAGASLHMLNHGLTAGALFALLAVLSDRYRTLDVAEYGGLWAKFPKFAFFAFVLSLAAVGLPGLNNFVSEMLILAGLFDPRNARLAGYGFGAVAAAGVFLSAWYTFTMLKRVFFGPLKEPPAAGAVPPADLSGREWVTLGTLAAGCLALGLFPQPVLDVIRPDAHRLTPYGDWGRQTINPVPTDPTFSLRPEPEVLRRENMRPAQTNPNRMPAPNRGPAPAPRPEVAP